MLKTINGGKMPTKGTEFSACVDLYANADVSIGAGETVVIPLGVCIDSDFLVYEIAEVHVKTDGTVSEGDGSKAVKFMQSHYLQLMLRSSLGKKGLILPNGVGVIDMDYADEMCLIVHNPVIMETLETVFKEEIKPYIITKGDRIAQIMLCEHKSFLFGIESEAKRVGGMGSTRHD